MATVKEIYALLDRKAPFRYQMDFDNAGFLVGRGDAQVSGILVALDITPAVIQEAVDKNCQLIVAHHPVIWGKLGQVTDETSTGRKVLALIEQGIAAICAHTNLDAAEGGVNTQLARRVGLTASASNILLPRKSVTAILGISRNQIEKHIRSCLGCPAHDGCQYRKSGGHCGIS